MLFTAKAVFIYLLQSLRLFDVGQNIVFLVYKAVMESNNRSGLTAWFINSLIKAAAMKVEED